MRKSFVLRRRAEQLISIAVRTVETAIAENETAAMAWAENKYAAAWRRTRWQASLRS